MVLAKDLNTRRRNEPSGATSNAVNQMAGSRAPSRAHRCSGPIA